MGYVIFYCTDECVIDSFNLIQKQTNTGFTAFIIKLLTFVKKETTTGIGICYR